MESQKLIKGNPATFRVKFNLTKLQEDGAENRAETNCSASENDINRKNKNKTLHTSDPRRPG